MNKEWSNKNKEFQILLKKNTFQEGIQSLLELRETLMKEMIGWKEILEDEEYSAIPFINADGYHSKTVAYSMYHIFRIEDIVLHSLILKQEQIFFRDNYKERMHASIQTTGNELVKEEIQEFSKQLDIDVLYEYVKSVKEESDIWLKSLSYEDLKQTFVEDKEILRSLQCVHKEAAWLIEYWCGKDIKGLLKMPFSRHWIMHIEASNRVIKKIKK